MGRFIPLGQAGGLANAGGLAGAGSTPSPGRRFIPIPQAMALQGSPADQGLLAPQQSPAYYDDAGIPQLSPHKSYFDDAGMEIRRGISGIPGPGSSPFGEAPSAVASRADPGMARAGLSIGGMNLGGNLADLGEPVSRGVINDAIRGFFGETLGLGPWGARIGNEVVNFAIGKAPFPTSLVATAINTATANVANRGTANARNQAMMDMAQPFGELPFGMPDPGPPPPDSLGVPPDPNSLTGRTFGNAVFNNPDVPGGLSYGVTNQTNFGTRGDDPDSAPPGPPGDDPGDSGPGPTGDDGMGDFAHGGTVKDRTRLPGGKEPIIAHQREEVIRPDMARRYRPLLKAINRGESPVGLVRLLMSGAGMARG